MVDIGADKEEITPDDIMILLHSGQGAKHHQCITKIQDSNPSRSTRVTA